MRRTLAALALAPGICFASCAEDAMIVLDASASMAGHPMQTDRPARIDEARDALGRVLPEVPPTRRMGLVIYGPAARDGEGSCDGVVLHLAPAPGSAGAILERAGEAVPEGRTALARAVAEAAGVLGQSGTVVLVTDGEETCGGRPCAFAAAVAVRAPGLTIHVIGFRMREAFPPPGHERGGPGANARRAGTDCLSDETGGLRVSARTTAELERALRRALGCALLF